jgi:hypothetical protein
MPSIFSLLLAASTVGGTGAVVPYSPLGPGREEWKVDSPENHGLSTTALEAAAKEIGRRARERYRKTI